MKNTLKRNHDFRRLYATGKCCVSGTVVIYAKKSRYYQENRLGLTTGKSIGNAVKRNRAKRLMREGYRQSLPYLKTGFDIVIVARNRIAGQKSTKVARDIETALRKLKLLQYEETIT